MNDENLRLEVEKLARRLARLERHVGLEQTGAIPEPPSAATAGRVAAVSVPAAPGAAAPAPSAPPPPAVQSPPLAPPTAPPVARPAAAPGAKPREFVPSFATSAAAPPPAAPPTAAARRERPERPERSIETMIGNKVLGGLGALIVVIGAAFAAREYGGALWFNLPSIAQALIIAGFGGLLLLGGEIALRLIGRPASLGLYAAGLGVLYMDAYATFQFFELVSGDASFLLMGLVAIGGFAITLRTRFLSIGVLSLIAGYMTPILLARAAGAGGAAGAGVGGVQAFAFITMLAGVALALAAWQPRPFRPLRYVALGGQCVIGLVLVLAHAPAHGVMTLIFISAWWSMFMVEAVLAAMRRQSPTGNVVVSLLATAAYVTCASWILNWAMPAGSAWLGAFAAMIAALCAATAMHFGPGLDALRGRLDTAIDKLAVALWLQAGVLTALAVAMQFDGYGASIGWLAVGLASIEIGRRLPSAGVTVFGLVVFGLAVVRVAVIDPMNSALQPELWSAAFDAAGRLMIDRWSILGAIAVIGLFAAANRIGGRDESLRRIMPIVLAGVGAAGWLLLCSRQSSGLALTGLWLLGAVALLALEPWMRRERSLEISLLMLLLIGAKWLLIDGLAQRMAPGWDPAALTPLLNAQMALAVAIAAAGWWGLRQIERARLSAFRSPQEQREGSRSAAGAVWQIAAIVGGAFLLVALSFEVDRIVTGMADSVAWAVGHMRQLMLTMLWTFGSAGFGLLAMSMLRGRSLQAGGRSELPLLLRFAWGLLTACAIKWLIIDTLFWTLALDRPRVGALLPFGNVQMLAAMLIAGGAVFLLYVTGRSAPDSGAAAPAGGHLAIVRALAPIGACVILLWGLSFEVDRLLGIRALDPDVSSAWPLGQLRILWLSGLWAAGGLLMMPLGRWRGVRELSGAGWLIITLSAVAWLLLGAIGWRLIAGPVSVPVVWNLQFVIGLFIAGALALAMRNWRSAIPAAQRQPLITAGLALIAILGFVMGSFEIDRGWMDNVMAKQMGLSIYWALYGAVLVLVGFVRLSSPSRHVGLALLLITIVKVLAIDMATVDQAWRVLSFIISGLLLIATSMAYAKLTPGLLAALASRTETKTHVDLTEQTIRSQNAI